MFSKNKWILANRNLLVAVSLSILTIASCGGGGGSGSSSPNEKPVSVSLTATPSIVGPGETTTLNWVSTNAKSCELLNQAGVKVASGLSDAYTTTLPLDSAAAFTITCIGVTAGDTVSQTKTFAKVSAKPTVTLSASPSLVASGATSNISWSSSNSVSCQFTEGSVYGAPPNTSILATSGSFNTAALTGGPPTRTFTIQCDGPGGSTIQSTPVTVGPPAPVISSFTATPSSITSGASTQLAWVSTNSSSCSMLGFPGSYLSSDTLTHWPTTNTTYTLTCTGTGGSATATTTVSVAVLTSPPTVTLVPSSTSITSGTTTTITWRADAGSSCTFTSGAGAPSGTIITDGNNATFTTPALTSTTTYSVSCTKTGLTASQSATINVISGICSTTGVTDKISLPGVVASRTIGVAPLSVFFDATGATAPATTRPFHELEYRWEFEVNPSTDIPAVGTTWGAGSRSGVSRKNSATGPVAAHVYETPGTYKVTLTVTDGTNTVTNKCTQITIQDPDVIFAGASLTGPNTICVGSTSTPTPGANGCPADALGVQQANFTTAITSYAKTGKRVLFKKGDLFSTTTSTNLYTNGPGLVGAFGTGANPIVQNMQTTTGYTSILKLSSQLTPNIADWRIVDLEFDGTLSPQSKTAAISGEGTIQQVTLLRLKIHDTYGGLAFSPSVLNSHNSSSNPIYHGHTLWDQLTMADSNIYHLAGGAGGSGMFVGARRFSLLGTNVDDTTGVEQVVRYPLLAKGVLSNNTLGRAAPTKEVIKLHGPGWARPAGCTDFVAAGCAWTFDTAPTNTVANDGINTFAYTEQVVISDNKLIDADTNNPFSVEIGPENGQSDQRVRDVIFERNLSVAGLTTSSSLNVRSENTTVRNNIFSGAPRAIAVAPRGAGLLTPNNINIFNNSHYSSKASGLSALQFIDIDKLATNISVKNNLVYLPNGATLPKFLVCTDMIFTNNSNWNCGLIAGLVQSNNSTDNPSGGQIKNTFPNWTSITPSTPSEFSPFAGSYAINGGTNTPVWSDFFLNSRPAASSIDMGAVEVLP